MSNYDFNDPSDYIISYDGLILTDIMNFLSSGGAINTTKILESGQTITFQDNKNEPTVMTISILALNRIQINFIRTYWQEQKAGILLFRHKDIENGISFEHSEAILREDPHNGKNAYSGVSGLQLNLVFDCSREKTLL